jgi:acyl-CoA synthetase (AMP-forming)/AMP-acid ligase II
MEPRTSTAGISAVRIHEVSAGWSTSAPQRFALSDMRRRVTYGELPILVEQVAALFVQAGVRAGDRVLLVAENAVGLAICIMALSRLDAWSATVNARLSQREIDNFIAHSGARRVVYFSADSADARAHGLMRAAEPANWPGVGEILLGALNADATAETVESSADRQVAVMVYTSGTTGASKAVMLTHRNLLFIAANSCNLRALVPLDVVYGVLPLSHVYGLSSLLVATLMSGGELRLVPRFQVAELAHALAGDVTVLHGAPAMYAKLLEWVGLHGLPGRHRLRVAQSGGAALSPSIKHGFEAQFGLTLQNGYGMTEAAPSICQTRMDQPRTDCAVGQVIPRVEARLHGASAATEGIGELCVRGPNVMKGYYRAPELTAEAIDADGWLHTGDLARIEADGAVMIVGRNKELIIHSGFNVYPVEVEEVLNAWPDIVQSAVVGRAVDGNEEVIAWVELRDGLDVAQFNRAALATHLQKNLSPYKIPARVIVLAQLPAAATGKILKKELQERAQALGSDAA